VWLCAAHFIFKEEAVLAPVNPACFPSIVFSNPLFRIVLEILMNSFCTFCYFKFIFVMPVLHEGRLHAVEGYPSECNFGLFLF